MSPKSASFLVPLLLICAVPACPTQPAAADADPDLDAGSTDASSPSDAWSSDDRPSAPKLPPPERRPLGAPCSASGDCTSGLCVDGVCCDTSCDGTCYACNSPGTAGACTPLDGVEDLAATTTCSGARVCAADPSGAAACKLRDGQGCVASDECASGACRTYYPDQDGDSFGVTSAPESFSRCDATPMPPSGFAAAGGDCCDSDPGAKPSVVAYFTSRNRCGTFDWNCNGAEERQGTQTCPTTGNQPIACGTACTIVLKGTASTLYVQACR